MDEMEEFSIENFQPTTELSAPDNTNINSPADQSIIKDVDNFAPPEEADESLREVEKALFEDTPEDDKPKKLEYLNDSEEQALKDSSAYWETKDLAFAGKLENTDEFAPGRSVRLHTLDSGEQIVLGKILDTEFGRVNPMTGTFPSSYDIGLNICTLSLAIDEIDGEPVYVPTSDKEDVFNAHLTIYERENALIQKSKLVRKRLQQLYPHIVSLIHRKYLDLLGRQDEAFKLLPFFSDTGQRLENFKSIENLEGIQEFTSVTH